MSPSMLLRTCTLLALWYLSQPGYRAACCLVRRKMPFFLLMLLLIWTGTLCRLPGGSVAVQRSSTTRTKCITICLWSCTRLMTLPWVSGLSLLHLAVLLHSWLLLVDRHLFNPALTAASLSSCWLDTDLVLQFHLFFLPSLSTHCPALHQHNNMLSRSASMQHDRCLAHSSSSFLGPLLGTTRLVPAASISSRRSRASSSSCRLNKAHLADVGQQQPEQQQQVRMGTTREDSMEGNNCRTGAALSTRMRPTGAFLCSILIVMKYTWD